MFIRFVLAEKAAFCGLYEALLFDKARNIPLDFFFSNYFMGTFYNLIDYVIAVVDIFHIFISLE